jgi:hypothetical protein
MQPDRIANSRSKPLQDPWIGPLFVVVIEISRRHSSRPNLNEVSNIVQQCGCN